MGMLPDQAAELLQWSERGMELLEKCRNENNAMEAIRMVQDGFHPRDVCKLYSWPWEEPEEFEEEEPEEGWAYKVWECGTSRCRQKGRVSSSSTQPKCPSCREPMKFVMNAQDESDFSHMRRTFVPDPGLTDPLARTDKTNAPPSALGDD